MDERAEDVLNFWLDEVGPDGWFGGGPELDQHIRERFGELTEAARSGALDSWICKPRSCLALILLLDQFLRNIHRGEALAYSGDARALPAAKAAIERGYDLKIEMPARAFFYMPFTHSELLSEQERGVRLFFLNADSDVLLNHARAHRLVIRRFGRFPYRNPHLGRATTPEEAAFIDAGGYKAAFAEVTG